MLQTSTLLHNNSRGDGEIFHPFFLKGQIMKVKNNTKAVLTLSAINGKKLTIKPEKLHLFKKEELGLYAKVISAYLKSGWLVEDTSKEEPTKKIEPVIEPDPIVEPVAEPTPVALVVEPVAETPAPAPEKKVTKKKAAKKKTRRK